MKTCPNQRVALANVEYLNHSLVYHEVRASVAPLSASHSSGLLVLPVVFVAMILR